MTEVPAHLLARAQAAKARATGQEVPVPRATPEAIGRMNMKTLSAEGPKKNIERKLKRSVRKHLVKEWLFKEKIRPFIVLGVSSLALWVGVAWLNVFFTLEDKVTVAVCVTVGFPTLVAFVGCLVHSDW